MEALEALAWRGGFEVAEPEGVESPTSALPDPLPDDWPFLRCGVPMPAEWVALGESLGWSRQDMGQQPRHAASVPSPEEEIPTHHCAFYAPGTPILSD